MILDKAKMAHEYAMLHMANPQYKDVDDLDMVQWAFDYADAMQAEADKRVVKLPDVFFDTNENEEWQPDWSQAPEWAEYWVKNINGVFSWYSKKPTAFDQGWFVGAGAVYRVCPAPSFNYQGNWQDSLRKRPQ